MTNPSTELATTTGGHGSALVLQADQERWNDAQVAALRQMGLDQAPQGDLDVFFHVAQRTGLDPFAKQIHMIGRKSKSWDPDSRTERWETKYTIQTGIDGYRVTAARAAKRESDIVEYEDAQWCGPDGQWLDAWLDPATPPAAARVVLIKNGRRYSGTAMYAEYVQTYLKNGQAVPNSMWTKMPAGQLAKCAEALAIRKAYPQDFAALYTDEEMGQAENPTRPAAPAPSAGGGLSAARARQRQLEPGSELAVEMFRLLDEVGIDVDARLAFVAETVGRPINGGGNVTIGDAEAVIAELRKRLEQPFDQTPDEDADTVDAELADETEEAQQ
jgi:phage recombination protein Bet